MHTFQVSVLIKFLLSSTCFEHLVLIIRKTISTCSVLWYVFHAFMCSISSTSFHLLDCLHKRMKNIP